MGYASGIRVRLVVAIAALAALFVGLARCKTNDATSQLRDDPIVQPTPPAAGACGTFCADTSEAGQAKCYSCKCKEAFDGYLPSTEELSCAKGKEIVIYKVKDAATLALEPVTTAVDKCFNPALLTGACAPGGKLGQLVKGDVTIKWICRRNSYIENWQSPDAPYSDVGVIGWNARNGASCWWDDYGGTITDKEFPSLDLSEGPGQEARVAKFLETYSGTEGDGCVDCHDNDPFMFTPYLRATAWKSGAYTSGAYFQVRADGNPTPVATKHLTSDAAAECASCHRISNGSTCSTWALESMGGSPKFNGYEEVVANAVDTAGPEGAPVAGPNWKLAYWMPPAAGGFYTGDFKKWHDRFAEAKAHIKACCSEGGRDNAACKWEPINPPVGG